jgi:hypothetical protein
MDGSARTARAEIANRRGKPMPRSKHRRKPSRQSVRRAARPAVPTDIVFSVVADVVDAMLSGPNGLAELKGAFSEDGIDGDFADPGFVAELREMFILRTLAEINAATP